MSRRLKQRNVLFFLYAIIVLLYTAAFYFSWTFFYRGVMDHPYGWKGKLLLTAVYFVASTYLVQSMGGMNIGVNRVRDILYAHAVAMSVCNLGTYVLLVFLCGRIISPLPILQLLIVQIAAALVWTLNTNKLHFRFVRKRRTIIIYRGLSELEKIKSLPFFFDKSILVREICARDEFPDMERELENIDCVFVSGVDAVTRNYIVELCLKKHIRVIAVPKIGDIILEGAQMVCLNGGIYLAADGPLASGLYLALKRTTDILLSLIALIVLSPVMAIIALIIHGYDKGPALYKQIRLTKDGKEFRLYKFRSMRVDAEKDGIARLSTEGDSRITPIGKILRAYRLDELPQLFNILRGDMAIVGPRPERPEIAEQYEEHIPTFPLRLQVRAGLTGYAQVYGKYNTTPYDKLQMDLFYISHMSAFNDMKLILSTVKILFTKEATQGVEDGMVTAADEDTVLAK